MDILFKIWSVQKYQEAVDDPRYVQAFILAKGGWKPYLEMPEEEPEEETLQNEED